MAYRINLRESENPSEEELERQRREREREGEGGRKGREKSQNDPM